MKFEIKWKRAYEKIEKTDGFRILVDKLWPGNVTMVYASRTPELSHIPVLKEFIEEKLGK